MRGTRAGAITLIVVLLAGCAGGAPGQGDVTELSLLLVAGPEELVGYQQLADALAESTPDLRLRVSPVPTQDDLLARLSTSLAGEAPPDLFLINFRKYGQFVAEGAVAEVQPYLEASDSLSASDFVDPPLDAFRFDGTNLSCQPQNVSSLVAYVNLDLFAAADVPVPVDGWTWDELVTAASALTGDGIHGLGTEPSIIRLAPLVWSNGGDVVDDVRDPTRLTLDTPEARAAYDFLLDLRLVHGVTPDAAEVASEGLEERFLRGALGIYLNSRKSVPTLRTIEDFAWDVVPLPVAPGGAPTTMLHSDAYCITAGTGNEAAAWRVIEFAMSRTGQELLAASGRTVPSRIDVLDSPAFLDPPLPPASSEVFADNARLARATPHVANWSRFEKIADDLLEAAYYGRLDRDDALRELTAEAARVLAGA